LSDLAARLQVRAASPELPLLRLLTWSRLPPLVFGVLCALIITSSLLLPVISLPLGLGLGLDSFRSVLGSALFFGASIGMLTGLSRFVFSGAAVDLQRLVTVLLWIAMLFTIPPLVQNAALFSSLGKIAQPDLLRPSRHAAFGTAALRPALFLIGILCAYTLLFIGSKNPFEGAVWIGILASSVPMLGIVALPLRGIRRRIREQRQVTLAALDTRLDALTSADIACVNADDLFQLDAILDMRERVAKAPSWPFDVAAIKRILLYTVLPPMTWAAAAIVEMMIDSAL
jgi:hypothetical protein